MRRMNMHTMVSLLCGFFSVLSAAVAFAAAAGHAEEPITFVGDWLPRLVNFAIIFGIVVYFTRKPIRDFFKNRTDEIARAMQESREGREKASADLGEMERKIRALESEIERMIADARARGEKDKQALIEEGTRMSQDIQNQVKQGIDLEVQKARTALQVEASLLAMDLAEGRIRENMSAKDHDRIVKEYISNVGGKA